MRGDSILVNAVVSLPLLDVKVRILRTFGQALVVTRLGSHFLAHKGSELHNSGLAVSCFLLHSSSSSHVKARADLE